MEISNSLIESSRCRSWFFFYLWLLGGSWCLNGQGRRAAKKVVKLFKSLLIRVLDIRSQYFFRKTPRCHLLVCVTFAHVASKIIGWFAFKTSKWTEKLSDVPLRKDLFLRTKIMMLLQVFIVPQKVITLFTAEGLIRQLRPQVFVPSG